MTNAQVLSAVGQQSTYRLWGRKLTVLCTKLFYLPEAQARMHILYFRRWFQNIETCITEKFPFLITNRNSRYEADRIKIKAIPSLRRSGPSKSEHLNHPVTCTTVVLLQFAVQPSQHADLSATRFVKTLTPCKIIQICWFLLFLYLFWGQQNLQPTVIRNSVFQFAVSK
jgi:hypothetical protein